MATSRTKLIEVLNKKFPKVWTKLGEEFSPNYQGSIWTGEGSEVDEEGTPAFCMFGPQSLYDLGVYIPLAQLLEKHGWFAEAHDGGTFFLFEA